MINVKTNSKDFIVALGKTASGLQVASAETLNELATEVREDYNKRLGKGVTRNSYTKKASRVLKSNPIKRSGQPRKLNQINSKVVIRNMSGGKEHYLSKLENGTTQNGNPGTLGKVPVPLDTARISKVYNKSIAGANRLTKNKTQTLRTGNRRIGVKGDGFSTKQRWAVLYRSIRSGTINGDPKKPFFMIDNSNNQGIFKLIGKTIRKIRKLDDNSVRFKAKPHMENSMKDVKKTDVETKFIKNAKKTLMNIK